MKEMHMSNMVRKYCNVITPERKAQMELKVVCERMFKGKRTNYSARVKDQFVSYIPGE